MTTTGKNVTAPGVSDPQGPAYGESIVPALPRSSSHDGQDVLGTSGAGEAERGGEWSSSPLCLRGGGSIRGSTEEEERERKDVETEREGDPTTPLVRPLTRSRAGPRSFKDKEKERREEEKRRAKERSSEREVEKGNKEDEEAPHTLSWAHEISRVASEARKKALESTAPEDAKALIRSVMVLRQPDRVTTPSRDPSTSLRGTSPGQKRNRESEEEEGERNSGDSRGSSPAAPSHSKKVKWRRDGSIETRGRRRRTPITKGSLPPKK